MCKVCDIKKRIAELGTVKGEAVVVGQLIAWPPESPAEYVLVQDTLLIDGPTKTGVARVVTESGVLTLIPIKLESDYLFVTDIGSTIGDAVLSDENVENLAGLVKEALIEQGLRTPPTVTDTITDQLRAAFPDLQVTMMEFDPRTGDLRPI